MARTITIIVPAALALSADAEAVVWTEDADSAWHTAEGDYAQHDADEWQGSDAHGLVEEWTADAGLSAEAALRALTLDIFRALATELEAEARAEEAAFDARYA